MATLPRELSMSDVDERLDNELSLLQAMYPEQIHFDAKSRGVDFSSEHAAFALRLPSEYLSTGLPTVLAANNGKQDLRDAFKARLEDLPRGEEVLDACIVAFEELAADSELENTGRGGQSGQGDDKGEGTEEGKATVVVWLHHLLNTNKRKLALSPAPSVSGITKPGYPGVLVYSGPAQAVREHVSELKGLQWAAFQVRLESDEEWVFGHGKGVREVEGMGEVVAGVVGRREEFMEAMRMK